MRTTVKRFLSLPVPRMCIVFLPLQSTVKLPAMSNQTGVSSILKMSHSSKDLSILRSVTNLLNFSNDSLTCCRSFCDTFVHQRKDNLYLFKNEPNQRSKTLKLFIKLLL